MIDTGATKSHIDRKLVPERFITQHNYGAQTELMNGNTIRYTESVQNSQIKFLNSETYMLP